MRNTFSGYYLPTNSDFSEIWQNCIFVFDANVLLNLYSYSPKATKVFFSILKKVSDRIWLPHQAALEYQDNRLKKISAQESTYEQVSSILRKTQDNLEDLLRDGHASIDVESLLSTIQQTFSSVQNELNKHKKRHPDLFSNDSIRNELSVLFNGKVGSVYDAERLNELYKVGEQRYEYSIPPGYKDKKKEDLKRFGDLTIKSKFGDLVLWMQLLDKAIESKRPILFITDDRKEDWWWDESGKTIGPRPELVTEVWQKAGVPFYMYTPTRFMENANNYLGTNINQEIIDEVRDVSEAREGWLERVVDALESLDGEAHLTEIYQFIQNNSQRKLSKSWQSTIRRTLYNFSSDVDAYLGGEDLFQHLGRGRWGLRRSTQHDGATVNASESIAHLDVLPKA